MNKYILFFCALVLIASCSKDVEPVYIYDIQDEFKIELRQSLGSRDDIVVKISTLEPQPDNYSIEALAQIVNGKIELNIYRIVKPADASNQKAYLSTLVSIDSIGNGIHEFNLIIRNTIVNEGAINATADKLVLDFTSKDGISESHIEVNRFPEDAFWGVIMVDSVYHEGLLDVFADSLHTFSADVEFPVAGDYGYFSISNDGILEGVHVNGGIYKTLYMTTQNFDKVNAEIQNFKSLHAGFHAQVITAKGQNFFQVTNGNPAYFLNTEAFTSK